MSRQSSEATVSSPRLLASAVGVAITAMSGSHFALAAEPAEKKSNTLALNKNKVA